MHPWDVEGWISTYTAIATGEMDVVSDHVRRLTGLEPVTVARFLGTARTAADQRCSGCGPSQPQRGIAAPAATTVSLGE